MLADINKQQKVIQAVQQQTWRVATVFSRYFRSLVQNSTIDESLKLVHASQSFQKKTVCVLLRLGAYFTKLKLLLLERLIYEINEVNQWINRQLHQRRWQGAGSNEASLHWTDCQSTPPAASLAVPSLLLLSYSCLQLLCLSPCWLLLPPSRWTPLNAHAISCCCCCYLP